ncbi:MAG: Bacteriocin/lantibiotic efflux ABC transporter, permease/ATP-binding protein [Rhodanobacteraceae bacterium]|jgi:ATP-binding cassette subfamily B protein RaxB|nr:MAG: Bacteriocin/lantibiotic efflux ABC transporter, permease/ATP-binding protein [Rhodanobacteraceae bacterium]
MNAEAAMKGGLFDGLQWGWGRKLPVILQTEAAECGLAALAMIARYHGHDVDLPSLRRKHSTSLKGANLARVMELSRQLGFETRPLRLELDELSELNAPCILHWDLNHFVVLERVTAGGAVIHDPARGVRKLSTAELSKHFTGVALECTPGADFKPVKARESVSLRALTGKIKGLPRALIQIFVLALALEVFALVGPFYLQWILDQVLVAADKSLLMLLGIGFLLVTVFGAAISAVRAWTITWLGAMLNVQWVTNVFSHLLRLPLDWYEKRHAGDVVSRFGSMNSIQQTFTTSFVTALLDGLMAVLTLVVLMLYSVKLTCIVLAAFALYGLLRWFTYRPLRRAQEDQIVHAARQETELLEAIRGAQTLKLHNQQRPRTARFANVVVETVNRNIAVQRLGIAFSSGNRLIFGVAKIAMIWLAALLVLDGRFTAGMLIAFVAYADQFVGRAASLIDTGIEFRMLRLHAERVADIALTAPERHVESAWGAPMPEASIELRNVSFRYAEGEPWIVKDCSLTIPAGESVALIGPSGCGKTTLAKIILGLLQPEEGEVRYGGEDIRRLGLARYRSQVGAVMQDDQLFAGSIADNIACFDDDVNPLRVEAAAHLAAIHDDIAAMPMGYQSLVGDMGSALSGGQKQRLLLARALYRKPALLVLDEATSHLDIERERQVNAAVNRLAITRIVIAHRPETIASAQHVLQVSNGAVQPVPSRPREGEVAG